MATTALKLKPRQERVTEAQRASPLDRLASLEPESALVELGSSSDGLSSAEAAARLEREGRNELASSRRTLASLILAQLHSPLLGLLLVAASVSIGVGERIDGGIILAIMGLSVGLGFANEYRSEQTLASLRQRTGRRATVRRDRQAEELPAVVLVPGDVCLLQTGDVVPADLRLLEASELTVDEAALTGEAYPAEKAITALDAVPGGVHADCAYMGTVVRGGRGVGVVALTGMRTRLGGVAGGLEERQPQTAFQTGLGSFTGLLARVTAALTVFIFVANAALGKPVLEALLFSLAIAVGLTPQLLPAIVTVSLSTGARRMAKKAVLVKRLVAIEDLGDADVLFTDKTGTLTEGEIRLREALSPAGMSAPELMRLGLLASELHFAHGVTPLGNTLDLAIWAALDPGVARAELQTARSVRRRCRLPSSAGAFRSCSNQAEIAHAVCSARERPRKSFPAAQACRMPLRRRSIVYLMRAIARSPSPNARLRPSPNTTNATKRSSGCSVSSSSPTRRSRTRPTRSAGYDDSGLSSKSSLATTSGPPPMSAKRWDCP